MGWWWRPVPRSRVRRRSGRRRWSCWTRWHGEPQPAPGEKRITLGADKLYQEEKFIEGLRQRKIVPHVAEYEEPSIHWPNRSEEHTSELQSLRHLVCRLLL